MKTKERGLFKGNKFIKRNMGSRK